jgi:hypothetical protein
MRLGSPIGVGPVRKGPRNQPAGTVLLIENQPPSRATYTAEDDLTAGHTAHVNSPFPHPCGAAAGEVRRPPRSQKPAARVGETYVWRPVQTVSGATSDGRVPESLRRARTDPVTCGPQQPHVDSQGLSRAWRAS